MTSDIGTALAAAMDSRLLGEPMVPFAQLRPGQRIAAHVLEMLSTGDLLLELGQGQVLVRPNSPLQLGDRVVLELVVGGGEPVFRIVDDTRQSSTAAQPSNTPIQSPSPAASFNARDLPVILTGVAGTAAPSVAMTEAGQQLLRAAVTSALSPAIVEQPRGFVGPPQAGSPPAELATMPRTFPAQPGLVTESSLLAVLNEGVDALVPNQQRPAFGDARPLAAPEPSDTTPRRLNADYGSGGSPCAMTSGIGTDLASATDSRLLGELMLPIAQLRPGQRMAARVLEVLSTGDLLLEHGQGQTLVRSNSALQPGDRVLLELVAAGLEPAFRIVGDTPPPTAAQPAKTSIQSPSSDAPFSPRDLPAILAGLASLAAPAVPTAELGQQLLHAAATSALQPAIVEQLREFLAPLQAASPPAELATTIRAFLAQSGLFTESHLLAGLKGGVAALAANQQRPAIDVRLLLGQMSSEDQPVREAVRAFGEALLRQQLEVVDRLATTGVGTATIPVMFGETRVDVLFEWDREAGGDKRDREDASTSLGIFVHLKALGAIEARLDWRRQSLGITFFVERESTRALVEAGLDAFSKELALPGFPAVTAQVWFNPARVSTPRASGKEPIPGGTILDRMA